MISRFPVLAALVIAFSSTAIAQVTEKESTPDVNPGRPTVADPAALTAPGWLEAEFGFQRDLDPGAMFGTPLVLKYTTLNKRLQYRASFDGYLDAPGVDHGFGDSYFGLQYLVSKQDSCGYDLSLRGQVKFPTAKDAFGTGARDYSVMVLASKDYSRVVHADYNVGVNSLSRSGAPGYDSQFFGAISFTFPNPRAKWAYTNEIVYYSAIPGSESAITTLHGFTYAVNGHNIFDIGIQLGLKGDVPKWQLVLGRSWMLGQVTKAR